MPRQSDRTSRRTLTVPGENNSWKKNKGLAKPALVLLPSRRLTPFSCGTTLSPDLGDKNQREAACLVLEQC